MSTLAHSRELIQDSIYLLTSIVLDAYWLMHRCLEDAKHKASGLYVKHMVYGFPSHLYSQNTLQQPINLTF